MEEIKKVTKATLRAFVKVTHLLHGYATLIKDIWRTTKETMLFSIYLNAFYKSEVTEWCITGFTGTLGLFLQNKRGKNQTFIHSEACSIGSTLLFHGQLTADIRDKWRLPDTANRIQSLFKWLSSAVLEWEFSVQQNPPIAHFHSTDIWLFSLSDL